MTDISRIIQEIQYVLAPAVMISSSALLLLGLQNKFSNLANRLRALNQERRLLERKEARQDGESGRLENLNRQIDQLMRRAALVKNAVLLSWAGIICFIATSILIFMNVYTSFQLFPWTIAIFLIGFVCLLGASVLMMLETDLSYRVISLERKS